MESERQLSLAVPASEHTLTECKRLQKLLDNEIQEHLTTKTNLSKIQRASITIQSERNDENELRNDNIRVQEQQQQRQQQLLLEVGSLREKTMDQAEQIQV